MAFAAVKNQERSYAHKEGQDLFISGRVENAGHPIVDRPASLKTPYQAVDLWPSGAP